MYKWKPLGTRTAGRPTHSWKGDIVRDLQLLKIKKELLRMSKRLKNEAEVSYEEGVFQFTRN
jgi:hypothetical protein